MADDSLDRLEATIRARKGADAVTSYTASLFFQGRNRIAQKLGEEAFETVIAACTDNKPEIVSEAADLIYHLLVLLADAGLSLDDVRAELTRREGQSGHDEKTGRPLLPPRMRPAMSVDATQPYDDQNIFAKILRGEIPSKTVFEDDHTLAFHDIAPWAPTHILVIPKGAYVSWDDFSARASDAEITSFVRATGQIARNAGLVEPGYRLLANTGADSHAEVPHLHVHILAGRPLGPMLAKNDGRS